MDVRRIGLVTVAVGAAAQVGGMTLDAWLHQRDAGPADGLLALENLGHVAFVGGTAAVLLGAALALVGPRLYAAAHRDGVGRRLAQLGAPVVALAVLGGAWAGASSSSLGGSSTPVGVALADDGHAHVHDASTTPERCDADLNAASYYRAAVAAGIDVNGGASGDGHGDGHGEGHDPDEPAAVTSTATATAATGADAGHGEHKGPQTWVPATDPAVCAQLRAELDQARAVAAAYPTAADARAAGYVQVTTYIPEIASHWMNFAYVDGTFEVTKPEMLLYDGNGLDATMVGLSYYLIGSADTAPTQGFAGGNTEYHRHVGLCVRGTLVVGGEATTPEECAARGGRKNGGSNAWMSHAWVVPGCESPWGLFSAANPKLTAQLGQNSGRGAPCSGSGTSYDDRPGVPTELAPVVTGLPST